MLRRRKDLEKAIESCCEPSHRKRREFRAVRKFAIDWRQDNPGATKAQFREAIVRAFPDGLIKLIEAIVAAIIKLLPLFISLILVVCLIGVLASPVMAGIPSIGTGPGSFNAWRYRGADHIGDYRHYPGLYESTVGGYRGHDGGPVRRGGMFRGRIFRR